MSETEHITRAESLLGIYCVRGRNKNIHRFHRFLISSKVKDFEEKEIVGLKIERNFKRFD